MKRREPPKGLSEMESEEDIITNLPAHIIDKILSHLSLRDAVRMSMLSSKWRYKWATIPHLVFDNHSVLVSSQDQTFIKNKLVNIVDHVLLLHKGPTHKFKLSHRDLQGVSDIDRWILVLSRGSVKEFVLEIWKGHRYKLPSSLYSCKNLIHLELFNCLLKPPPLFNGFKSLKSLDLQHITMVQDVFEHLIASCPLLERLTLMNFDGFTHLNIHAPNLLFFDIGGVFEAVNFQHTFQLAIVSIGLYINAGYDQNPSLSGGNNMVKFFSLLPRLQRLEVQNFFLKYLAAGKVGERLPDPCIEMSYLSLHINFEDREECNAALCLLRSSPNLQELDILVRQEEVAMPNGVIEDYEYCSFTHLRFIKIAGISGIPQELNFINYLLANSPSLERMTIKPASSDLESELLKDLLRFRRASVLAEIFYVDP
jgi:hypothetical protein